MGRSDELKAMQTDELLAAYESSCADAAISRSRCLALFHELQRRQELAPEAFQIYEQLFSPDELVDPSTGIKLTPSWHGRECLGNGDWLGYECCCDECDHYQVCFPDWDTLAV